MGTEAKNDNEIRRGEIVSINVEALYEFFGDQLHNTKIDKTGDFYFDLYNQSNGDLACMNGEECCVEFVGKTGDVVFRNENGDEDVLFTLTAEEVKVAVYT